MAMTDFEEARLVENSTSQQYPVIGETLTGLGEYLERERKLTGPEAFAQLREDTIEIVKRSKPFDHEDGSRTGLVVGYVQSGKTMSMTAVSALARDNGCRIIVMLAGVTTNLLEQSAKRFRNDLREASGESRSVWRIINTDSWRAPAAYEADKKQLQQSLNEWRSTQFDEADKRTLLFMVLKNHTHLGKLASLLSSLDLRGVPALILDDEADQAGLDTKPQNPNESSATYERIRAVRNALPNHTYLQYTATPQAPLLIALDDMLSPAFAELVRPGEGYTGGIQFFGSQALPGISRSIPAEDLFKPGAPPEEMPDSLAQALRVFFVGAAVASERRIAAPRSMLVHPSQRTADHGVFLTWINETVKRWSANLEEGSADRDDVLAELRSAYDDLAMTDSQLPPFNSLFKKIALALHQVSVKEINGEDGSDIDWENSNEHILVGGEKLNRGFTVEGLTVTYMPRSAGEWNADTIQQRARFFGYKKKYLSLCRLFLHPDVLASFRSYVVHEEDVRSQLLKHRGKPLRSWRRAFFLSSQMRPTRRTVLSAPYFKFSADNEWLLQREPHVAADAIATNRKIVNELIGSTEFANEDGYFEHKVAFLPLSKLMESLVAYDVREGDRAGWYARLIVLSDVLETNPNAEVVVVRMAPEPRRRTPSGSAIAIHQGASGSAKAGDKYPGDNKMVDGVLVTLQIHRIDVLQHGPNDVPALALHIPSALHRDDVGVQVRAS